MVDEAKAMNDLVATHIAQLRLEKNAIVLNLRCGIAAIMHEIPGTSHVRQASPIPVQAMGYALVVSTVHDV